jgi:hypothetical protein
MRDDELEGYVRRKLRNPSRFPSAWSTLVEKGYVDDVNYGAKDADWLVDRAREILVFESRAEPPGEVASEDGPRVGQERIWALSQLVARHAATDPDVVAFRERYLSDGLIPRADVEEWINAQATQDGERTSDVTFTIPPGTTIEWNGPTVRFNPSIAEVVDGIRFSGRTIAYSVPGDTGVRRCAVKANGVLDLLSKLGESVGAAFAWQPAQAVVHILTGVTPLIAAATITVPVRVHHDSAVGWARRIKLDVDPAATSSEVLAAFEQARAEYRVGDRRSMSAKHLRLAAYAGAEHADKPWAERHRLWNRQFPDWTYPHQSNFRRDATAAQQRLLDPWSRPSSAR